jgi:hypothetical protein
LPTALAKMSPGPPDRRAGLRPSDQAAPLWVFTSIAGPLSTPRAPHAGPPPHAGVDRPHPASPQVV